MHGSIAHSQGVLWVGRSAKTASVRPHDLDGHPLSDGLEFRDSDEGRSSATGLDVDADRRIWVADAAAGHLRAFTLFGREVVDLGGDARDRGDARGAFGAPVDVRTSGSDDELELLVASAGHRRYALQVFRAHESRVRVLPPLGDTEGRFEDLAGIDWTRAHADDTPEVTLLESILAEARAQELILACERRRERIQVFRDGRFHYAIDVPGPPLAARWVFGGRLVVALGAPTNALLLLRADGRPLRTIAGRGEVDDPSDFVWLPGEGVGEEVDGSRLWVVDRDGERVQLFTVDGRAWGAFPAV